VEDIRLSLRISNFEKQVVVIKTKKRLKTTRVYDMKVVEAVVPICRYAGTCPILTRKSTISRQGASGEVHATGRAGHAGAGAERGMRSCLAR